MSARNAVANNAVILVALLIAVALFYNSPPAIWSSAAAQGNVTANVLPACNSSLTVNINLISDMACNGTALQVYTDDLTIDCKGHSIIGNGTGYGIYVNSSRVTVKNCIVRHFSIALYMDPISGTISNNTYEDNEYGLVIEDASGVTIRYNTIKNNSIAGMLVNNSNSSSVYNNTFDGNSIGLNILNGTDNVVWYNTFLNSTIAHARSVVGNHFNITIGGIARGNNWSGIFAFVIYDSNGDGFGDTGNLPYSAANGGFVLGSVEDWGPMTTRTPPAPSVSVPAVTVGIPSCSENWTCTDWSDCSSEGMQTRDCADANRCAERLANRTVGNIIAMKMPETSRACEYIPIPTCSDGIQNQGEEGIDCGGPCPSCPAPAEFPMGPVPPPTFYIIIGIMLSVAMLALGLWVLVNFILFRKPQQGRTSQAYCAPRK